MRLIFLFFIIFQFQTYSQNRRTVIYSKSHPPTELDNYLAVNNKIKVRPNVGMSFNILVKDLDSIVTKYYKPKDIRYNETLVPIAISDKEYLLMRIEVNGYCVLYVGFTDAVVYYAKRSNEKYPSFLSGESALRFYNYKKKYKLYFEDCPLLVQKIDNKEFKRKELAAIVTYYNQYCSQ